MSVDLAPFAQPPHSQITLLLCHIIQAEIGRKCQKENVGSCELNDWFPGMYLKVSKTCILSVCT